VTELTTLCYITRGSDVLFMVKAESDKNKANFNAGKYLGVGGHIEEGEAPFECAVREIYEETGIRQEELKDFGLKGVVTFVNSKRDDELMYIYKGEYIGDKDPCPGTCDEGTLCWVDVSKIYDLPMWEGDKAIFKCLFGGSDSVPFELKLTYDGDILTGEKGF